VDDFAIAAPDEKTADILLDLIDDQLTIPLKRQGLLDMFNGVDVVQTQDYIKISCQTYIDKFCEKYLNTWLGKIPLSKNRPIPLPTDPSWLKKFSAAMGLSDPDVQKDLSSKMQIKYKAGVGELIWAMTTCQPDISFTSVKLSQSNSAPAKHIYHGLKHAIRYVYITQQDGSISGGRLHERNCLKGPYPWSIAIVKISSSTIALITTQQLQWHMVTLIGLHALKRNVCSVESASSLPAVRLRTRLNSNQPLRYHPVKQNL
jgi:hypothetical protein